MTPSTEGKGRGNPTVLQARRTVRRRQVGQAGKELVLLLVGRGKGGRHRSRAGAGSNECAGTNRARSGALWRASAADH